MKIASFVRRSHLSWDVIYNMVWCLFIDKACFLSLDGHFLFNRWINPPDCLLEAAISSQRTFQRIESFAIYSLHFLEVIEIGLCSLAEISWYHKSYSKSDFIKSHVSISVCVPFCVRFHYYQTLRYLTISKKTFLSTSALDLKSIWNMEQFKKNITMEGDPLQANSHFYILWILVLVDS